MKYVVYHASISMIMFNSELATQFWKDISTRGLCFTRIAEVEGEGLEDAFDMTNHIEDSWQKNPGVTVLAIGDQAAHR